MGEDCRPSRIVAQRTGTRTQIIIAVDYNDYTGSRVHTASTSTGTSSRSRTTSDRTRGMLNKQSTPGWEPLDSRGRGLSIPCSLRHQKLRDHWSKL